MIFKKTKFKGVFIIHIDPIKDKRGFFARSFCQEEFNKHDLDFRIIQSSLSYNKEKGTLRGMHYQTAPFMEKKLVSCIRGEIYDVVVDLRPNSNTYCKWFAAELNDKDFKMLYIPEGFAHGFQTLSDNTIVFYQISQFYQTQNAGGVRWDDPAFNIKWPKINKLIISEKDQKYPYFNKEIK